MCRFGPHSGHFQVATVDTGLRTASYGWLVTLIKIRPMSAERSVYLMRIEDVSIRARIAMANACRDLGSI